MDSDPGFYSGFFLGLLPDKPNGNNLIKVACFEVGSDFRRVLDLETADECKFAYGEMIHFKQLTDRLAPKSLVKLIKPNIQMYHHDKSITDEAVHTIKELHVGAANLPASGNFIHPDFGEMIDTTSVMSVGSYVFITFRVVLHDRDDSFDLEILGGQKMDENAKNGLGNDKTEEFLNNIHEVIAIEQVQNRETETAIWQSIGMLVLKGYNDKEVTSGLRPVMELIDKSKLPLFLKRKETAPIAMIKQKEMGGYWVDDDDEKRGAPQYGSLFPRIKEDTTKKKRPTGRPQKAKENVDDQCIIGLKRECRHQFETIFKIGDVFRFESSPTLNNYSFWINKKHRQNEIYRYTVEEQKPKGLEIQTVIESHHSTDPEDFKLKADTDFKDDGTPRGDLNEKQFAAIRMALNPNRLLVCIQGPPGTGKSHVLSIFLFKLLKDGKQAVVLTPTKEALKNLKTMTLKMVKQRCMKLHPHALMDVSLFKEILNTSDAADAAIKTIRQWREMFKNGEMDQEMLDEKRNGLTKDLRQQTLDLIMQNLRIVFATMESTFTLQILRSNHFNPEVCVIDEAAQVMETATWPAVNQMKRIVMAGDPKQLPALVKTEEAKARQLERSVMERIIEKKDQYSWIMLEEQYRSHRDITDWSNGCFYDCKLTNCTDMNNTLHTSLDPKPSKTYSKLFNPLVFIDTCLETDPTTRIRYYERSVVSNTTTEPNNTYCNHGEAELVMKHYERLLSMSIPPQNIAIITPYKGQIDVLTAKMNEFVAKNEAFDPSNLTTIGTIDSVQGQEYDCVIFSMVRSNPKTTIGFIAEVRRLNVVVTRAKRHFIFIGNGYMLHSSHKPEIRKFFEIIQYKEQRFHPNLVCGIPAPGLVTREVKNNFGQNFQPFIDNSNDPRMIEWCQEFIENSRKPDFVQRRRDRAEQRQEEARIRAQMDFEARELKRKCNVSNGQDPPAPIP